MAGLPGLGVGSGGSEILAPADRERRHPVQERAQDQEQAGEAGCGDEPA